MPRRERTPSQERWLRFFNDVLYARSATAYNVLDRLTFGAWWRLIRSSLAYVPAHGRALEIGFGPGRLHVELVRHVDLCLGLDLGWDMCQFTRRRLLRAGMTSHIACGNVFALPYPTDTFEATVSTFAFSGFPDGLRAMQEMVRVTCVGGQIVLVDIGLPTDANRLGTILARLWERIGDFLYDLPELMQLCGLEVTVFEEFGPGNHIRAVVGKKTRQVENGK